MKYWENNFLKRMLKFWDSVKFNFCALRTHFVRLSAQFRQEAKTCEGRLPNHSQNSISSEEHNRSLCSSMRKTVSWENFFSHAPNGSVTYRYAKPLLIFFGLRRLFLVCDTEICRAPLYDCWNSCSLRCFHFHQLLFRVSYSYVYQVLHI